MRPYLFTTDAVDSFLLATSSDHEACLPTTAEGDVAGQSTRTNDISQPTSNCCRAASLVQSDGIYIRVSEETAIQVSFVTSFGGWGSESSIKAFYGTCTVSFVRLPEWQKKKTPHCPSRPRGTRTSSPRLMNVAGA